jgi:hypothetical protein
MSQGGYAGGSGRSDGGRVGSEHFDTELLTATSSLAYEDHADVHKDTG